MPNLPNEIIDTIAYFCDGPTVHALATVFDLPSVDSFWNTKCFQEHIPKAKDGESPRDVFFQYYKNTSSAIESIKCQNNAIERVSEEENIRYAVGPFRNTIKFRDIGDGTCRLAKSFDKRLHEITEVFNKAYIFDQGFRCLVWQNREARVYSLPDWKLQYTSKTSSGRDCTDWRPLSFESDILISLGNKSRPVSILHGGDEIQIPCFGLEDCISIGERILTLSEKFAYIWNTPDASLHRAFDSQGATSVACFGTTLMLTRSADINPPTWTEAHIYLTENGDSHPFLGDTEKWPHPPTTSAIFTDRSHALVFAPGPVVVLAADGSLLGQLQPSPSTESCCTFLDTYIVTATRYVFDIWSKFGEHLVSITPTSSICSIHDGGCGILVALGSHGTRQTFDFVHDTRGPEEKPKNTILSSSEPQTFVDGLISRVPYRKQQVLEDNLILKDELARFFGNVDEHRRLGVYQCIEAFLPHMDLANAKTSHIMSTLKRIVEVPDSQLTQWQKKVCDVTHSLLTAKYLAYTIKLLARTSYSFDRELVRLDQLRRLMALHNVTEPLKDLVKSFKTSLYAFYNFSTIMSNRFIDQIIEDSCTMLPTHCSHDYRVDFMLALYKYRSSSERQMFSRVAVHFYTRHRFRVVDTSEQGIIEFFEPLAYVVDLSNLESVAEALLFLRKRPGNRPVSNWRSLVNALCKFEPGHRARAIRAWNHLPFESGNDLSCLLEVDPEKWELAAKIFSTLSKGGSPKYRELPSSFFRLFLRLPSQEYASAARHIRLRLDDPSFRPRGFDSDTLFG